MKTEEEIQYAIDAHVQNGEWIKDRWSGMTYAEGVVAALEWLREESTDEEFFDGQPGLE